MYKSENVEKEFFKITLVGDPLKGFEFPFIGLEYPT